MESDWKVGMGPWASTVAPSPDNEPWPKSIKSIECKMARTRLQALGLGQKENAA